ncbi:MAG: hypothetical protein M3O22_00590 [Pseudomonadota bacterium]|nr:hypothetical protein [Pseudomonadota bacterium]
MVAAVLALAAVINHGVTDSFVAAPFLAFLVWAVFRWGRVWTVATACVFGVLAPLYAAKLYYPALYYPVIGQKIHLTEDVCATDYGVLIFAKFKGDPENPACIPSAPEYDPGAVRIPAGTVFRITEVGRKGFLLMTYTLRAQAVRGDFKDIYAIAERDYVFSDKIPVLAFENGHVLTEADVTERPVFFWLSHLLILTVPALALLLVLFVLAKK